ncbi:tRNA(His) guanylyltransferase Thg1 family protein [uncultured Clostridium sp.]|uniref:tRNA(His) guanylyltransferase Thg1 family protein n=1 Tax=uncultured Clostridium sp. TaxID=59620 RepID=UPI002610EF02|nr:tRNA(His) guanylyltransferase Thg1 family protein [uncultured Clostridium sp.]
MKYDALGIRMKEYEAVTNTKLVNRTPVIIRLDGRAFHTFTKGFKKPFDDTLNYCMQETMKYLCENITNCIFGYTQSDEITLVLLEQSKESQPWFDNRIQKIVSSTASMATLKFNQALTNRVLFNFFNENEDEFAECDDLEESFAKTKYANKLFQATFDTRVFNLSKEEVINCIIWRQQDATKNSISSLAQANFSHKQLQGKNSIEMQDMLVNEKGINWNDIPTKYKRGSACIKKPVEINTPNGIVTRNKWVIDDEMPIITQDRDYINRLFDEDYNG